MKKQIWIIIIVLLLAVACTSIPTSTEVGIATSTETPNITETFIPFPTNTPTATATITPTPTQVNTPTIIEVTPIGPMRPSPADYWQGLPSDTYFVPDNNLNVRSCPNTVCAIIDKVYAGERIEVYSMFVVFGTDVKWLCRMDLEVVDKETNCPETFVYEWEGRLWGSLWLP